MNASFPARILEEIQKSELSPRSLAAKLAIDESTLWRIKESLRRGELPDKGAIIAICWALGFDKPRLDLVSQHYDAAKQVVPSRRRTTEQRSIVRPEKGMAPSRSHPSVRVS